MVYVPLYGWVGAASDEGDGFAFGSASDAEAYFAEAQKLAERSGIYDVVIVEAE